MSQGNQFHQYGYDHYLKAPKKKARSAEGAGGVGLKAKLLNKAQSPLFATVALLGAGALFASVIFMTYPSSQKSERVIPIIKADLQNIKVKPTDAGGLKVPNRDSALLARAGQQTIQEDARKIENLLARAKENITNKESEIAKAMIENPVRDADQFIESTSEQLAPVPRDAEEMAMDITASAAPQETAGEVDNVAPEIKEPKAVERTESRPENIIASKPAFELKEPTAKDILQKIGSTSSDSNSKSKNVAATEFDLKVASAARSAKPSAPKIKPPAMKPAGQSPETLNFVRNVLQKKDGVTISKIEPAAGMSAAPEITAGLFFVQLASITDPARAGSEWVKVQKKYGVLSTSKFRVQEASLPSGKFYRIQAGPMSKSSADEICASLKASKKPGGCLVVK